MTMTQQEFFDRTGIKLTPEEFEEVHKLYLRTTLNKDDFCKDYKAVRKSTIVKNLYEGYTVALDKIIAQRDIINELIDNVIAVVYYSGSSGKSRDLAIKHLGFKEYIKRSLAAGYKLQEKDRIELINLLNN